MTGQNYLTDVLSGFYKEGRAPENSGAIFSESGEGRARPVMNQRREYSPSVCPASGNGLQFDSKHGERIAGDSRDHRRWH
jgi:hypothetical protein